MKQAKFTPLKTIELNISGNKSKKDSLAFCQCLEKMSALPYPKQLGEWKCGKTKNHGFSGRN